MSITKEAIDPSPGPRMGATHPLSRKDPPIHHLGCPDQKTEDMGSSPTQGGITNEFVLNECVRKKKQS